MSVMGFNAGFALQAAIVTEKVAIAASNLAGQAAVEGAVQRLRSDRPVKG